MSGTSPSIPDFRAASRNDQVLLGASLLTFIFSFIAFAKVHVKVSGVPGFSGSSAVGGDISAWHGIGFLAGLLILVALVVAGLGLFAPQTVQGIPVSWRVAVGGLATLALLFFVIRWLSLPSYNEFGVKAGYKLAWGGYLTLLLNIVAIVFSYLGIRGAGEALPWEGGAATPPAAPAA
jgi:hypothetical protein